MIRSIMTGAAALTLMCAPLSAETIALRGNIWTNPDTNTIENGVVIIEDGEINRIGDADTEIPDDIMVLGDEGNWVTPGIIAPFSRLGIIEVSAESSTDDRGGASAQFASSLRAADGFNPSATPIGVTRIEGVTHAAVAPTCSHTIIAGLGFIANTSGKSNTVIDSNSFLFVELGERGAEHAGGSRSAAWAYLRGALAEGEQQRINTYRPGPTKLVSLSDARVLANVVRGRIKLMLHAQRASDLLQIIELQDDYSNLDIIIVGAAEGWLVADELANAEIPVIIDPFDNLPQSFESLAATGQNARRLIDAGVQTAFANLSDDGHQIRLVLQSAGNAVANGVAHEDALAAITTVPADIFDLTDAGKIEPGSSANLVVWDGDPLQISSSPIAVIIDGELQSLESRQTRLRDRYLSLEPTDKPFSYKKPR